MTLSDTALDVVLKRLHLANARRVWRDLTLRAEHEQWSCRDFLALLMSEEIAQRQQTRLGRVSRWAQFPFLKTIDDFDFTYQSVVRLSLLGSALASDFVTEGRSLILSGKPGRGKTHLAIAIAYRAIQNGFDARFVTAAELIDDLSAAFRAGRLADALITYTHPAVLVVDEVGYLTYGTDAANMLFHVVNDRHRHKRSMIFTTNKSLTAWGHVLHDDDLAQAIIDRVLERGRLLPLDGPSMRTKHLGLDDPTSPEASLQLARSQEGEVIRVSGIQAPKFPEPTDLGSPLDPPHPAAPVAHRHARLRSAGVFFEKREWRRRLAGFATGTGREVEALSRAGVAPDHRSRRVDLGLAGGAPLQHRAHAPEDLDDPVAGDDPECAPERD